MVRKYWEDSRVKVYLENSRAKSYWDRLSPNQKTAALFVLPGGMVTSPVHLLFRGGRAFFRYVNGSGEDKEVEVPEVLRDSESDLKDIVDE